MINVLKFRTHFSFCSQRKFGLSGLEFAKCLSEYQTGKMLITAFSKQSDLGLHYLSRPFWQVTIDLNIRTFTIHEVIL